MGNIKATSFTYASRDTILAPGDPHVYVDTREAVSVHALVDRVGSFDLYPDFASFEDFCAFEKRILSRPHYAGTIEAYRAGDIDGLIRSVEERMAGGYSGGLLVTHVTAARAYWRNMSRIVGSEWRR